METKQAIKIVEEMQLWRRGKGKYDEAGVQPKYTPKEFGEALDKLIEVAKKIK